MAGECQKFIFLVLIKKNEPGSSHSEPLPLKWTHVAVPDGKLRPLGTDGVQRSSWESSRLIFSTENHKNFSSKLLLLVRNRSDRGSLSGLPVLRQLFSFDLPKRVAFWTHFQVFNLLNTTKSRRKCNSLLLSSSFWLFSLKIHATLFAFFDTFGCLSFLLAFVKQRNSEKIPPTSQYFVVSFVIRKKSPNLYHEGFWTPPVHRGRSLPSGTAACVPLVRTVPNGKGLGSSF